MHHARPFLAAAFLAAALIPLSSAFAHGEGGHGKAKAFDPAKVEEKAFGRAGDPRQAKRTIRVAMNDRMQFVVAPAHSGHRTDAASGNAPHAMPGDLVVKRGETVRFLVRNEGKAMHEMVIGTLAELKEHAELMRRFPDMEHDEPYMAHVAPGKQGEIVWQFSKAGEFYYACLVPGHMEAGMVSKITVK